MGKAFFGLFLIGGLFIALILCFPFHQEAQPHIVEAAVVATPSTEEHIATVCSNASTEMFGSDFAEYDQAVAYCMDRLLSSYNQLGHWPGPEMNGNVSNAFWAAQQAADVWALLDTPFVYRSENGRETIMLFMKQEREAYGL